jgi:hypothetical protein
MLYQKGGMTAGEIAENFDGVFREHLQPIGIPQLRREEKKEEKK